MKIVLQIIEVALYLVFMALCFVLLVSGLQAGAYFPPGGVILIPLLLVIALVHRIRCGPSY